MSPLVTCRYFRAVAGRAPSATARAALREVAGAGNRNPSCRMSSAAGVRVDSDMEAERPSRHSTLGSTSLPPPKTPHHPGPLLPPPPHPPHREKRETFDSRGTDTQILKPRQAKPPQQDPSLGEGGAEGAGEGQG